jgi:hypothetical protein
MKAKVLILILLMLALPCTAFAVDIIGTGKNQTESLNNALSNLSCLVSDVKISAKFSVDRRIHNDKEDLRVVDLFSSQSDFYVENVKQYVSELSERKVVIRLSERDVKRIRARHRQWKQKPDIKGSVAVVDDKAVVSIRELSGVDVTIRSISVNVKSVKVSLLCSAWKESQESKSIEMLDEPLQLSENRKYQFEADLSSDGFSLLDIGKRIDRTVSVVVMGVDHMGRKVEVEL